MLHKHSVRIDRRKCVGCTNCIKCCPTEAIRVQRGKAKIIDERCIDCGECLRVCPHRAMIAVTTPLGPLDLYPYNIVIPCASLFSQFRNLNNRSDFYEALYSLGFDGIYEEARAAEIEAEAIRIYIRSGEANFPIIACSCSVVSRLITTLYPSLVDNLSPFVSPAEIAARVAKKEFSEIMNIDPSQVGCHYISPCAAKMTNIKSPLGISKSEIASVYSVKDVYAPMMEYLNNHNPPSNREISQPAGAYGLGTAVIGGLSAAVGTEHYLAVDGTDNVKQCLEEIDNQRLRKLYLVEAAACSGGCVGGPLMIENQFVAKNRNRRYANSQARFDLENDAHVLKYAASDLIRYDLPFEARDITRLSDDMVEAIRMMEQVDKIKDNLPGLDCGSCGSPSCKTLAEDIVRGQAVEMDCIFKLRDKLRILAQEMADLASAEKRG